MIDIPNHEGLGWWCLVCRQKLPVQPGCAIERHETCEAMYQLFNLTTTENWLVWEEPE